MNDLIAMENAFSSAPSTDWETRCGLVAEAGFAGIYAVPEPFTDARLAQVETLGSAPARAGLKLAGLYVNIDFAHPVGGPDDRRVTRLFESASGIPRVEVSFKCTDSGMAAASWNDAISRRLEPLLTLAERRGFNLALYPHSFYPLESPEMAEDLVRRLRHPRLGFVFSTSHAYALWPAERVVAQLRDAAPRMMSFNVCGCRRVQPVPPAPCLNLPLDEGDLDLAGIFEALSAGGYRGDIIVQGYGWQGDIPSLLRRSAEACRHLLPTPSLLP